MNAHRYGALLFLFRTNERGKTRRAASRLLAAKRHTRRSGCRRRRLNNDPSKKDYCPNMNIRQSPLSPLLSLSHLMPSHTKKWEGMVRQKREENMSCRIGRIKNYDCVLDRLFLCPSPQRRERGFEEERKSEKGFKVNNRQWQNI